MARDGLCLLTGATGFIGGHLAERLVRDGYQVRCVVRTSSDTSLVDSLGVELVVADLTSSESLRRAVRDCDYVLHCGAMVSDWALPVEVRRVNVQGTRDLLRAAGAAAVGRFVHISSTDVYGYPGGRDVEEIHTPARFRNWYSETKRAAELEVLRASAEHDLKAVILRPATVYGPRSREVVMEIARALRAGNMLLIDGGRSVAGLCFVENLVDAALLAMTAPHAPGQALNVTDGLDITWRQFVDGLADGLGCPRARWSIPRRVAEGVGFSLEHGYRLLRRMTGLRTRPLLSRQAVHVMGIDQSFSNRRAREVLGWEPRVGYTDGLRATLEWLRAEGV